MEITELPLPENTTRIETGPIRFGDDWAGVFLRGDHALYYAEILEYFLKQQTGKETIYETVLEGLVETLRECAE